MGMTSVPQGSPSILPLNLLRGGGGAAEGWDRRRGGHSPQASLTIFLRKAGPRPSPKLARRLLSSSGLQQGEELLPRLGGSGLGGLS